MIAFDVCWFCRFGFGGVLAVWACLFCQLASAEAAEPLVQASSASTSEGMSFPSYLADLGLHSFAIAELQRVELLGQPQWHGPGLGYGYGRRLLSAGYSAQAAEMLASAAETDEDAVRVERHQPLRALALARNGQTAQAVALVSRLENFTADPQRRADAMAVRCLIHLHAAESTMGGMCVRQLLGPKANAQALAALEADEDSWAFWHGAASAVVPGLGQALAGEWRDGGAAAVVNGSLGAATWSLLADGLYIDASLLVLSLTARYYAGNIQHAADAGRTAAIAARRQGARRLADQLVEQGPAAPPRASEPPLH